MNTPWNIKSSHLQIESNLFITTWLQFKIFLLPQIWHLLKKHTRHDFRLIQCFLCFKILEECSKIVSKSYHSFCFYSSSREQNPTRKQRSTR